MILLNTSMIEHSPVASTIVASDLHSSSYNCSPDTTYRGTIDHRQLR